ncbi:MAG: thiamine pyrophosphate-dependent enzyme [Nitrospira sp.]|nr:thiamine pyrophosphate-dependent enzyme [Nitrospira sp.]
MKKIMLGNEAVARGAFEAGVRVASGYPGTPSTEILEEVAKYDEIYTEWSVNEKVAMDVGIGASLGGVRSMVTMKHAGVNVASDPFVPIALMGINGGLVLFDSDDVGAISSPTEQDTRIYAKLFHVPMLEPSDSQEAKDFTVEAYKLSEMFDVPVYFRLTNGVSHSKGVVSLSGREEKVFPPFDKSSPKYRPQGGVHPTVMHDNGFKKLKKIEKFAEESALNRIEPGDSSIGIITSGICYQYAKEVLPFASFLKLGITYPLPVELIKRFASTVKELYVVEELEPFLEEQILAMGIPVKGSELRPHAGAISRETLFAMFAETLERFGRKAEKPRPLFPQVIKRFPTMCSGCLHLANYYAIRMLGRNIKDKETVVMGDIGCYSLGVAAPHNILACAFAMGSGISSAHGLSKALENRSDKIILSYLGDSTFLHAGIPSLLNALYNHSSITVVVANNGTTAMTGGQEHAGTGKTIKGGEGIDIDIGKICRSIGVPDIYEVDSYDYKQTYKALKSAVEFDGVSVVIASRPCCLFPKKSAGIPYEVLQEACTGCGNCLNIYCPSIMLSDQKTAKGKSKAMINTFTCNGCSLCSQICPSKAIKQVIDPVRPAEEKGKKAKPIKSSAAAPGKRGVKR